MESFEQPFWMKDLSHYSFDSLEWYCIKESKIREGTEKIAKISNMDTLCEIAKRSPVAPFRALAISMLDYDKAKETIVSVAYNDPNIDVALSAAQKMRPPFLCMELYRHFCEKFEHDYKKLLDILEMLMAEDAETAESIAEALSRYLTLSEGAERYARGLISDTVLRAAKLLKQLYKKTGCEAVRRYNGRYPLWHEDSGMVCHYDEVQYMTLEIDID